MYEGTLVWRENAIAVEHFANREVIFTRLKVGQEIQLYQNGYWHEVKVRSTTEAPYIADWEYGDGLGCEVRLNDEQV